MRHFTSCDRQDQCTQYVPWHQELSNPRVAEKLILARQGECATMLDEREYTDKAMARRCYKAWSDALKPTARTMPREELCAKDQTHRPLACDN